MKNRFFKHQLTLWSLILVGLGLFSASGQNRADVSSVLKLVKARDFVSFEKSVPTEHVHVNKAHISRKYSTENENDWIFEVQEEEDDKLFTSRQILTSHIVLPAMPWLTQTNDYIVPVNFFYEKQTSCLYLKKQVFLI